MSYMERKIKHLCSLLGRTFIIASPFATKNWGGDAKVNDNETDYESLDNFISYEEGNLTSMKKTPESIFYIYYSMSSKVEVFSIANGFIICDGLYFNESWDYSNELHFKTKTKIDLDFNAVGGAVYVYDAALVGESVLLSSKTSKEWTDRKLIDISDGLYSINRVETSVLIHGQEVLLQGIMLSF
jgi:hypothetical protein